MILLYSLASFAGAALLFAVEPLFTRLLLPLVGGAPGVWNTALVFFQIVLLAGYGYAHLTTKWLGVRRQAALHLAVLLLPIAVLPLALPAGSAPPRGASPVPWLLATLALRVGPPFFAVSATGPLLQRWFASTGHARARDPYFLYAAGNLGSMLALLAYPIAIEPFSRLRTQAAAWALLYGALGLLIAGCAAAVWRAPRDAAAPIAIDGDAAPDPAPITPLRRARWVGLAFVPSSLMMGVTTHLTTDVASVPLFWIVPLALYLLTFILASWAASASSRAIAARSTRSTTAPRSTASRPPRRRFRIRRSRTTPRAAR
jgi:hypothetical protein